MMYLTWIIGQKSFVHLMEPMLLISRLNPLSPRLCLVIMNFLEISGSYSSSHLCFCLEILATVILLGLPLITAVAGSR
jgi:hypothetical protein